MRLLLLLFLVCFTAASSAQVSDSVLLSGKTFTVHTASTIPLHNAAFHAGNKQFTAPFQKYNEDLTRENAALKKALLDLQLSTFFKQVRLQNQIHTLETTSAKRALSQLTFQDYLFEY